MHVCAYLSLFLLNKVRLYYTWKVIIRVAKRHAYRLVFFKNSHSNISKQGYAIWFSWYIFLHFRWLLFIDILFMIEIVNVPNWRDSRKIHPLDYSPYCYRMETLEKNLLNWRLCSSTKMWRTRKQLYQPINFQLNWLSYYIWHWI